jgi:integrase/recombinase XerD
VDKLYDNLVNYLNLEQTPKNKKMPMFPNMKLKRISNHRIREIIRQAVNRAAISERVTPHVLRHTFATHMYQQNIPVDAIMDMMGHTSITETSLYIHVTDDIQAEILKKISIQGD